jgi:hypothetical protein
VKCILNFLLRLFRSCRPPRNGRISSRHRTFSSIPSVEHTRASPPNSITLCLASISASLSAHSSCTITTTFSTLSYTWDPTSTLVFYTLPSSEDQCYIHCSLCFDVSTKFDWKFRCLFSLMGLNVRSGVSF